MNNNNFGEIVKGYPIPDLNEREVRTSAILNKCQGITLSYLVEIKKQNKIYVS